MPVDVARLRAFHSSMVRAEAQALADRDAARIARDCEAAIVEASAFFEAHRAEIEQGAYGGFARFCEVYRLMLERFREVLVQSFALDAPDPGGLWGEAERTVAVALPWLDDPRSYALRTLTGRPPFEPPGALARRLLDLRVAVADVERWKQRAFQASWTQWGRLVWTMEHQFAYLATNLGDPLTHEEVAFTPFAERLARLRGAYERKHAAKAESEDTKTA